MSMTGETVRRQLQARTMKLPPGFSNTVRLHSQSIEPESQGWLEGCSFAVCILITGAAGEHGCTTSNACEILCAHFL